MEAYFRAEAEREAAEDEQPSSTENRPLAGFAEKPVKKAKEPRSERTPAGKKLAEDTAKADEDNKKAVTARCA